MSFSILFYCCIGLVNVYIYQLTKRLIFLIVRNIKKGFSNKTSFWLILIFKSLNTLVIEHQPGSPCAGTIFANVYNVKLSFWLSEADIIEDSAISKQRELASRILQNHKNLTLSDAVTSEQLNNFTFLYEMVQSDSRKEWWSKAEIFMNESKRTLFETTKLFEMINIIVRNRKLY